MKVVYMQEMLPIDLHCHSTNSDGAYKVRDLLDLAKANGGKYLALTDHDTVLGIKEAKEYAKKIGLTLIPGVEISVSWHNNELIHILGLNVDETNHQLVTNLNLMRTYRLSRGQRIAENLAKVGIKDALEGALKYCENPESLSRTHFAHFLVEKGYVKPGKAFDRFLARGKPGYVSQQWASLKDAITWIIDSGGIPVIAHPARYKLTRTKLLKLIAEFKEYGGQGIEVISSSHSKDDENTIAAIAQSENLLASLGSDFHNINENYVKHLVGINHPLPNICTPIYTQLGINELL